jgi:hypothetical protein
MTTTTSFARDIAPVFNAYKAQMMWRFDLTSYDAVKGNAELILGQIKTKSMPPPPFDPLSQTEIETFEQWIQEGCPP